MTRSTGMYTNGGVRGDSRVGRPFVYTLPEALVLILIGLALIASAAIPAMIRHPHVAKAYERGARVPAPGQGR
jgi:hypothetical protein